MLIDEITVQAWDHATLKSYREAVNDVGQNLEDPWPTTVYETIAVRQHVNRAR